MRVGIGAVVACVLVAGCTLIERPTSTAAPTAPPSPTPVPATPVTSPSPRTAQPSASPTPGPTLSLALPALADERRLRVGVNPQVPPDGNGTITVSVRNLASDRINEIVLRWPTGLGRHLFLAPFLPTEDRTREGGPPLVQDWTRWVVGPGERGEPEGTVTLGYGPMDAGMQLDITLYVSRLAPGPVAFDLQLLAGEALMTLENGAPAEMRIEVP